MTAPNRAVEATRAAYRAASPAILAEIDLAMGQAYNAAKLPAHATSVAVESEIEAIKGLHDRDSDGERALACLRVLYRLATTATCRSMVCEAAEWVKGQQEQIAYEAAAADKREWMFDH
jgi:hypothetical protein